MPISSEQAKGGDANPSADALINGSANTGGEDTHHEHRMFGRVFPRLHRRKGRHDNPGLFQYAKDSLKRIGASDAHWRPRHQPLVGRDSNLTKGEVDGEPREQIKQAGPTTRAA